MVMTDKKPYTVPDVVQPNRYIEQYILTVVLQSDKPEDFMDRVKNSLAEGEVLKDYSIVDDSGFYFM
tara:strand:- start:136 stop:336 length:201 start_codon:yes stop_codon:yes gene_type:complete